MFDLPTDKRRLWVLCSIAVFLSLGYFIWKVPQMGIPASITDEKEKAELLNANRDNALKVIQTIAGLGFIGTAYLAWRNLQLTEDKNVTDRFSKAVEMLADNEKLEVRLGGIYSLERIARDSKSDHPVVMEVLTAFVRARSTPGREEKITLSQDIQSTLTVIGRRTPTANEQINLSGADLNGTDLNGANLRSANLTGAKLINADLNGTDLNGANLRSANLTGAKLINADLSNADLTGANFSNAFLFIANLSAASLRDADFSSATLTGANLSGASLRGADFSSASLSDAKLINADFSGGQRISADFISVEIIGDDQKNIQWNDETKWPDPAEVAKALNIPETLKQQLGITDTPQPPDS
ncbi:pentapeptide repeat-containing protein [Leptolyngbya sp. CCNP1308]|uniref:pentapeptide repeat-containing protein n=1 Tax=Leptolyngbya sp. CCNP1308 TaxID=3110255 RepID=UPI002B1FF692|nr:pentapeptide repeat-containing protein [Leptolyngbya sp. CCNP1308]MEA5448518.1 pentapeptide repeat-containing protein [Leptolyngbya sp. CCNP1308]